MAVLVVYAQPSRVPGSPLNYDLGDIVSVLEDGQHPGVKAAASPKLAFVKVPGPKADYLYLRERDEIHEFVPDEKGQPTTETSMVELRRKRRHLTEAITKATAKELQDALDWDTKMEIVSKAAFDLTVKDKTNTQLGGR